MDRQLKKRKPVWKWLGISAISLAILATLAFYATDQRQSTYRISRGRILTAPVEFASFQDFIPVNGVVEPRRSVRLAAQEGGRVEEIFVESGDFLDSGQAIMRLSNRALKLDFMNRETQIIEQINILRSTRINLENSRRNLQEQKLTLEFEILDKENELETAEKLLRDSAFSKNDFHKLKREYKYLRKKSALLAERFKTDEIYRQNQLNRIDASLELMERNLTAIRENLEQLVVRAPMSGQLNSFNFEIGQNVARAGHIGRIDKLDEYIIKAQVDQYYLPKVSPGQKAVLKWKNDSLSLELINIQPTIVNNQFEVHLRFLQAVEGIKRGQNMQLDLLLSGEEESLVLPNSAFYVNSAGRYAYVLDENNEFAYKRAIQLGAKNPNQIKVIDGLKEGEKVIISSYQSFEEVERIRITE